MPWGWIWKSAMPGGTRPIGPRSSARAVAGPFPSLLTGAIFHWAVGAAFVAGAVSIALHALGVADVPWWYLAFVIVALTPVAAWARATADPPARDRAR
jgi:hypothetical protein